MIAILSLILLFSLLALCVGLASPRLVSKGWKRVLSRKEITLMFGGMFLFCFVAITLVPPPKKDPGQSPRVVEAPNVTSSVPDVAQPNNVIQPPPVQASLTVPVTATSTRGLFLVSNVVDGDTIDLTKDGKTERIRIIGLDTPETVDPRKPVQCFGKEASAKMKALLLGKEVALEEDPSQGTRDKYQRLLGYVSLPDGTDVGLSLIKDGYAHEYTYDTPYERQAAYKAAESAARVGQKGLWAPDTCNGDTSSTSAAKPSPDPAATGASSASESPAVKKSTTGICHGLGSSFYDRTKNFTPYDSMQDCLKSGGRASKV